MGMNEIRITIYHWIPMVDNMLLKSGGFEEGSIENILAGSKKVVKDSLHLEIDAITYQLHFSPEADHERTVIFRVAGKVNNRGFTQHSLILNLDANSLVDWLKNHLLAFKGFISELLFDIVPYSVRNNAAVLHERIVAASEFESRPFSPSIFTPAQEFFSENNIVIITLQNSHRAALENVGLPTLGIDIPLHFDDAASSSEHGTVSRAGKHNDVILFFSDQYDPEELRPFDGVLYRYAALLIFTRVTDVLLNILKQTRAYIPPMRRQLAIALQHSNSLVEDFTPFTKISRYLGYVSIKLPVIKTVRSYLNRVYESAEFKTKLTFFENPATYQPYKTLTSIEDKRLTPAGAIQLLTDYFKRLNDLFSEDKEEIEIFSEEISRHLNITLSSERARISARDLQASETSRELNRGGKNRAEALKGLSIVTAGSLGLSVAGTINQLLSGALHGVGYFLISMVSMIGTISISWWFINQRINQKSAHFHLVIDVRKKIQAANLSKFVNQQKLKRSDIDSGRRIQTWSERFSCTGGKTPRLTNLFQPQPEFDVTFDYQMDGLIHTISVECEFVEVNFDPLCIVIALFTKMKEHDCLEIADQAKTPLFAEVLMQLGINLEPGLPGLNYLFTTSVEDLEQKLKTRISEYRKRPMVADIGQSTLLDEVYLEHIRLNWEDYIKYLEKMDVTLINLLGDEWIRNKRQMLARVHHV